MSGDLDSLQAAAAAALRPAGGGVTRESVGRFMNRVGEYFLALLDDLAPMPHHQRQEIEERVGALFLKDFFLDADYRTLVDNLLPLVRRNREREALERVALVEALAAVAFLHTILPRGGEAEAGADGRGASTPVERLTFHALDRFFRVTLNSTREVVRSRLMANVEYQDLFGDDGLAELVDRRWRLAFDEVRAALVSRTAVSEQRLADLLTVGTLSRTPARTFNQQYARLWEIVTVRVHGFPIPVVRRGVAPETLTGTPASPRGTQAMLLRWGHTQLTFVWHGDRLAAGNVALVNRLIPGTEAGRPVLRFDNCLVKRNGTLELLELAAPARVDYLFLHGLHPDLISGAHEATGVPMPWGAVLQKVTYAKAVYHEVYAGTPVRFPRQVCWLVAQTKGRDPDLVKQEILHRVIDFLARHPDIAGLVVKPGGESGGRGVRPFPKEALDAIVEWGYQISRSDDAVFQEELKSPPLESVLNRPVRALFGRDIDPKSLAWSARSIITRDANGNLVTPIKVILINVSGGVASMSQGAHMFLMDDVAPSLPQHRLERASEEVWKAVSAYCRRTHGAETSAGPLDGGTYLEPDCLLLDWVWTGAEFVHIEPNIGLGTFWYHDQIVPDDVKGIGVIHMLRNGERRALAYARALAPPRS